jgi:hypothetical protein
MFLASMWATSVTIVPGAASPDCSILDFTGNWLIDACQGGVQYRVDATAYDVSPLHTKQAS